MQIARYGVKPADLGNPVVASLLDEVTGKESLVKRKNEEINRVSSEASGAKKEARSLRARLDRAYTGFSGIMLRSAGAGIGGALDRASGMNKPGDVVRPSEIVGVVGLGIGWLFDMPSISVASEGPIIAAAYRAGEWAAGGFTPAESEPSASGN